jgi:broad specificity phosphatase PhoE
LQQTGELWLIRHGETEWSLSGAHTGRTDLPLTPTGEMQAAAIGRFLAARPFALVLTSPMLRARDTCRIAGYGAAARIEPGLSEWDYGAYEGRTTTQIRETAPGWSIWTGGVPGGETIDQVAARARAVISHALEAGGDALLFAHGHILRILAACWLGLPPAAGQFLALNTATLSILGYERDTRVIARWNQPMTNSAK